MIYSGKCKMKNERYYYGIMSVDEKKAYKVIYEGIRSYALNIVVSLYLSPECIQDIYMKVLYDNPLFYYINQTVIRMSGSIGSYILMPEYIYRPQEIKKINRDIRSVINKVSVKAETLLDNEFRLEKYLHDSVVKSVAYDYESLKKTDCFNAHSIVGAFLDKKAVCEGIAKAFKLLCNEYSIKCIVVLGQADPNRDYSGGAYHAWNLVKINNKSYHVDVTWDNMYDKGFEHISYDYFNLTTDDILKDHRPFGTLPLCDATDLNYFSHTDSMVSSYNELTNLIRLRMDRSSIMFKINEDFDKEIIAKKIEAQICMAVCSEMIETGNYRRFTVMFNESQSVGKILFR